MLEIYYSVYFIFIISILAIFLVWNSQLHKNPKFSTILNLVTALTILFTSFAIIIQLYTFSSTQADTEVTLYQTLFDQLIGETITTFENNPKMNYFYNQMFRPLHYNPETPVYNRNYSKEQQIVHFILQKTASIVYLLNNDKIMSPENKENIKQKLGFFYNNMIRSPIFIENYNHIKPQIYNMELKRYLQVNYNI
jgi:hypothetical protein